MKPNEPTSDFKQKTQKVFDSCADYFLIAKTNGKKIDGQKTADYVIMSTCEPIEQMLNYINGNLEGGEGMEKVSAVTKAKITKWRAQHLFSELSNCFIPKYF